MPRHTLRSNDRNNNDRNNKDRNNDRNNNNRSNNRNNQRNDRDRDAVPNIFDDFTVLTEKIYAPVDEYPECNFAGQLFGTKGSNIKQLVQSTRAKISILGRGSTKDVNREEELAATGAPEHAHFKEPLHVVIQVKAPRIAAHQQMAKALKEVQYWLVPRQRTGDIWGGVAKS